MADPAHRLATIDDLIGLDPDLGWEVLGGDLVQKASPTGEHADAQAGLTGAIRGPFHRPRGDDPPGGWWILTEATIELEPHEVVQPDIAGWRRDRVPERPKGWPVRVRPDWVCEVLSPSTGARDKGPKRVLLYRHGVGHYWTVNPDLRLLEVYRRTDEGYVLVLTAGPGERVRAEPFEAIELDVGTLFGDDPLP